MTTSDSTLLSLAIFVAAILYASVGHAGASGYLAAMAFLGVPAQVMRPTSLVLNLLVACIASVRFYRAGFFSWKLFWPFALGSIPFAYVGGGIVLPGHWYRTMIGCMLWIAAVRLWLDLRLRAQRRVSRVVAVASGAVIGLLAGLTATGGGIFLSPLLLFMGWAETKETGGVSAVFILVNSLAGLAGNPSSVQHLPAQLPVWATAAVIGGAIGADIGSRRMGTPLFRKMLGVVLTIAGAKLVFT